MCNYSLPSPRREGMSVFRGLMPVSDGHKRHGREIASAKKLCIPSGEDYKWALTVTCKYVTCNL